jgi:stress response protein YsnF
MAKTIVGLYDDRSTAYKALNDLEEAGFGSDHLSFASNESGERHTYEYDANEVAQPSMLTSRGIPEDEANFYSEGVRRGGAIVVARVHDTNVDMAVDIMARHNPVRYEDRAKTYQSEGFSNYDADAPAYTDEEITKERSRFADEAKQRMREVEENLKVGKREYVAGGVRVHKYVDTENVSETLRLRHEHVDVDRKNVNRALTPEEADRAFTEDTVELVERAEEAVVNKEARVTGEVAVGKDVEYEDKTITDTLRSTRIEVEQLAGEFEKHGPVFEEHYATAYASTDNDFDYYKPAYQYGYAAGQTENYRDYDYDKVEPHLRDDYNTRYGKNDDSAWDNVKDAVRHGYHKAKSTVTT